MKASKKTTKYNRTRLHERVRKKVTGTLERPRLSVSFTGQHIYAQIIDDEASRTLVGVSTTEKSLAKDNILPNAKGATRVGQLLAQRAKDKKIAQVVFDRGGFKYQGKVKALADAAREGGLDF